MGTTKQAIVFAAVLLGALIALSACGAQTGPGPGGNVATPGPATPQPGLPDRVRIVSDGPALLPPGATFTTPEATQPEVTLADVAQVRQLYATIKALPVVPPQQACPAIAGPQYTLTFLQGTVALMTAKADKGGCGTVSIEGETTPRQASSAFWQQFDQAIIAASPLLQPDRVAIATAPHAGQAPKSVLIASATTAQQLYDAILALPRTDSPSTCAAEPVPTYQIVFFSGDLSVPASVGDACRVVEVDGGFQSRGGRFAMNDTFRSMFQSILSSSNVAPAEPDHVEISVTKGTTASHRLNGSDRQLMLALFSQIFQLPQTAVQPNCPPNEDKQAGKGTFTTLAFSQWGLPLVRIDTYQGSCSYVQMSDTGPRLQANQAFWDLIDRIQMP